MIFLDTSAIYAHLDRSDQNHERARALFAGGLPHPVTTNFVFDELITLTLHRLGYEVARRAGMSLRSGALVDVIRVTDTDEHRAWEFFLRHGAAGASYTDCVSFAVMQRLGADTAFSFDTHFAEAGFRMTP